MSDWAAIEQALKRIVTFTPHVVVAEAAHEALAAVGEAKRRESELNAELDASWEESQYQLKTRVILKLESQVARLEAEKSEAEARAAELSKVAVEAEADMRKAKKRVAELERALKLMVEAFEKHDEWCGHRREAPGNGIWHRALDAAREALGAWQEAQPPVYGFSDTTNEARGEATGE